MKLTRMKELRPKYRKKLQRPQNLTGGTTTLGGTISSHYKIIENHFILKVCFTFIPDKESPSIDPLTGPIMRLCPHLSFSDTRSTLHREICTSFETFQCQGRLKATKQSFSCHYCPMDVELEIGKEYAKFFVWYDLGTGQHPLDSCWINHSLELDSWNTLGGLGPPKFGYKHGSGRQMYESEII